LLLKSIFEILAKFSLFAKFDKYCKFNKLLQKSNKNHYENFMLPLPLFFSLFDFYREGVHNSTTSKCVISTTPTKPNLTCFEIASSTMLVLASIASQILDYTLFPQNWSRHIVYRFCSTNILFYFNKLLKDKTFWKTAFLLPLNEKAS
jgi:hypothetical protein